MAIGTAVRVRIRHRRGHTHDWALSSLEGCLGGDWYSRRDWNVRRTLSVQRNGQTIFALSSRQSTFVAFMTRILSKELNTDF